MFKKVLVLALAGIVACSTDDVNVEPPDTRTLYAIADAAFGDYLAYLATPGTVTNSDGSHSIDVDVVPTVTDLEMPKTSSGVEALTTAGVATADTKIANLDGLQKYTGLQTLVITSNAATTLDTTLLTQLSDLELNFNLVGTLDLSKNPALTILRYAASSSATDQQKLSDIDLSANTALRHLYLPGHNLTAIDLTNNTAISEVLDLSGNPGPDGDTTTADIVVPDAIYDAVPADSRAGVIRESDAPVQLTLRSDVTSIQEAGGVATLTARLNRTAEADVTFDLVLGGNATEGADYAVSATSLTIPTGSLTVTITITGIDDSAEEGLENITATVDNVVNAQKGVANVNINLIDDETAITLVLNEVLYDPPDGTDGDANGDGTRDALQDEFVELVNTGTVAIDLSGLELHDSSQLRHTIPSGTTLQPSQALVVFGGGTPVAFGSAIVQTASGGQLNLNNAGDVFTVQRPSGAIIITFDIEPLSDNPNESYTRAPDLTGDFVQHHNAATDILFSPGFRADGTTF